MLWCFDKCPRTCNACVLVTHGAVVRIGPAAEGPSALLAVLLALYLVTLLVGGIYGVFVTSIVTIAILRYVFSFRCVLTPVVDNLVLGSFCKCPRTCNGCVLVTHGAVIRIGPTAEGPRTFLTVLLTFYRVVLLVGGIYGVVITLVVAACIFWNSLSLRCLSIPVIGHCVRREFIHNSYFMVFIEIRKGIATWILRYIHFRAINGYSL